jgi:hypothetical protein
MKNITRKFIIEVRAHLTNKWHDKAWHDFMSQLEAEAVRFAIQELGNGADYNEIAQMAREYVQNEMVLMEVAYAS